MILTNMFVKNKLLMSNFDPFLSPSSGQEDTKIEDFISHQKENFADIWEVNLLSDREKELFPPIPAVEESISLSSPTVSSSAESATASEMDKHQQQQDHQLFDPDFFNNYPIDDSLTFLDDDILMDDLDNFPNAADDLFFHPRDQEENKQQHISNIPIGMDQYKMIAAAIEESIKNSNNNNMHQHPRGENSLKLVDNIKTEPSPSTSSSTSTSPTQDIRRKRKSEHIKREIASSPQFDLSPQSQIAEEQENEEMDVKPSLPKRIKRSNTSKSKKVAVTDENKPERVKKHQLDPKKFPQAKNAIQAKKNRERKKQELIDMRIKNEKQKSEIIALRKQALQYQMALEANKETESQLQLQLQHEREARRELENSTSNYKAIADVLRTSLGEERFPGLITELLAPSSGIVDPLELVDDNLLQMHYPQYPQYQ